MKVRHPKGESRHGDLRIAAILDPMRTATVRYLKARERMLADKGLAEARPLACPLDNPNAFYSYGRQLLDRGASLESVSLALGHSSTSPPRETITEKAPTP